MTAFTRVEHQVDSGVLLCEIRSINHRYLDMNIYLPESVRSLEMAIRERIRHFVKRGKVECNIRYQAHLASKQAQLNVNMLLVKALCRASESIAAMLINAAPVNPADFLQFPGVLEKNETGADILEQAIFLLVDKALHELVTSRAREGEELERLFLTRLHLIQQELVKVREQLPKLMADVNEKIAKRFVEAKLQLDPTRLEQEMVMFAHKIDIAEEIDRIETHVVEVLRVLKEGGSVGRRLDFLMQELNREANTLGSKSTDSIITHTAVEMKVLVEQIREQVQNVE
jgi:uncharacterized protein (TIGR00255 family)